MTEFWRDNFDPLTAHVIPALIDKCVLARDLTEKIVEATDYRGKIRWDRSKPDGQPRRLLDSSRARDPFGFEASTSLEEGIEKTVSWYLAHRENLRSVDSPIAASSS